MTSFNRFTKGEGDFATHDIDLLLGQNYLVTVHDGHSRSVEELREHCPGDHNALGDGPVAMLHRIVDLMVERYLKWTSSRTGVDEFEDKVFSKPTTGLVREIIDLNATHRGFGASGSRSTTSSGSWLGESSAKSAPR